MELNYRSMNSDRCDIFYISINLKPITLLYFLTFMIHNKYIKKSILFYNMAFVRPYHFTHNNRIIKFGALKIC